MISSADLLIVAAGLGSALFFFVVHVLTFRSVRAEHIFKAIISTFGLGLVFNLVFGWTVFKTMPQGPVFMLLSAVIYSLTAFVYVLCIFGPYETSIRMRLLRELSVSKDGMTLAELLSRYNTAAILDKRLQRLLGAGDIARKEEGYILAKQCNAFFAIDAVAQKLHAFIHSK
jgi:hypothetical protein